MLRQPGIDIEFLTSTVSILTWLVGFLWNTPKVARLNLPSPA
ncbi:MAG: hypothetical protein ABIJ86_09945 [Spirochaetota bacterium]